jgi:ubiquinone biosynthesis accessory factor UbiJ
MHLPPLLLMSAEKLIEHAVRLDPPSAHCLAQLADKVLCLHLSPPDIRIWLLPHAHGIALLHHYDGTADVSIHGAPLSLLRLMQTDDNRLLNQGEVVLEGDSAVAQRLTHCLKNLEIDWEEQLSHLVGDIPAHWLGHNLRQLHTWGRTHSANWASHIGEYAQEEAHWLPPAAEVTAFMDDVDTIRDDIERLHQRILRLEQK